MTEAHKDTRLLTTAQAAAVLGYTPRMLEARRTRGGGPSYVRISGRAIRYRVEDLVSWIEERLVKQENREGGEA